MKTLRRIIWFLIVIPIIGGWLTAASQIVQGCPLLKYPEAGTYSTHFNNAFSFSGNLAQLSGYHQITGALFSERRYLLEQVQNSTAVIAIPSGVGGFGLEINSYGFAGYRESRFGIAYGRKLSESVSIGAGFHYDMIQVSGYGNAAAPGIAIGLLLHPTEKVVIGFGVTDPVGGSFGKSSTTRLGSRFQLGVGYEASEQVMISAEIIKQEDHPVCLNALFEYRFAKQFISVLGVLTDTGSPYFGLGWQWKQFRLDLSASYHVQLGFSPGLLLVFGASSIN